MSIGQIIINKEIKLSIGSGSGTGGVENYYMSIYDNGSFLIVSEKIYGQSNNYFRNVFKEYIVKNNHPLSSRKIELIDCMLSMYNDTLVSMILTQFRGDEIIKTLSDKLVSIIEEEEVEEEDECSSDSTCSDSTCTNNENDEDNTHCITELTEKSLKIHTLEQSNNELTNQLSNLETKHKQLINTIHQFVLWNTSIQIFIMGLGLGLGFIPKTFYAIGMIIIILYNYWIINYLN